MCWNPGLDFNCHRYYWNMFVNRADELELLFPVEVTYRAIVEVGCFCSWCSDWIRLWFASLDLQGPEEVPIELRMSCRCSMCFARMRTWLATLGNGAANRANATPQRRRRRVNRKRISKKWKETCRKCFKELNASRNGDDDNKSDPPHHENLPSSSFFRPVRARNTVERVALATPRRTVSPIRVPAIRACEIPLRLADGTTVPNKCIIHSPEHDKF